MVIDTICALWTVNSGENTELLDSEDKDWLTLRPRVPYIMCYAVLPVIYTKSTQVILP